MWPARPFSWSGSTTSGPRGYPSPVSWHPHSSPTSSQHQTEQVGHLGVEGSLRDIAGVAAWRLNRQRQGGLQAQFPGTHQQLHASSQHRAEQVGHKRVDGSLQAAKSQRWQFGWLNVTDRGVPKPSFLAPTQQLYTSSQHRTVQVGCCRLAAISGEHQRRCMRQGDGGPRGCQRPANLC
jgi:hypothetical protein